MMRLIKTINQIPVDSLILWKKFAYIKQLIKNAREDDLSETDPKLFAAFLCILGNLHIAENDILTIDPAIHVFEQIKSFFDLIAKECKTATADDLLSITLELMPLSENNAELYGRINMLYQIRLMQHGPDAIVGCFNTLLAAMTFDKTEMKENPPPEEYSAYINNIITKLKFPVEQNDSKEHFSKLFENKDTIIEDCVCAFEEVFENTHAMKNRLDIYQSYLKVLQRTIHDEIKLEPEVFKKYFYTNNFEDFNLLVKDYQNSKSDISQLLTKNQKLKKSLSQYMRAISIGEEKAPQPTWTYWKYIFG